MNSEYLNRVIKSIENEGYDVSIDSFSHKINIHLKVQTLSFENQVLVLDDMLFNKLINGNPLYKTIAFNSITASDVYFLDRLPKNYHTILTDYAEISLTPIDVDFTPLQHEDPDKDFSIILNFIRLTKVRKVRRRKH